MNKQSLLTDLKWVIVLFFSIAIGNIFMHFFEQTSMNVWIARGSFPNKRILRNNLCLPACKQKNIATKLRDTA